MIIPIPFIIPMRCEEEREAFPFERKEAKDLYDKYRAFLKDFFSEHDLHEWIGQMTSDPWSPGLHYICRIEKRKFFKVVPYDCEVAVAEIVSEPKFAKLDMDTSRLRYDGLELRVIDPSVRSIIDGFCTQYAQQFHEQPTFSKTSF